MWYNINVDGEWNAFFVTYFVGFRPNKFQAGLYILVHLDDYQYLLFLSGRFHILQALN